MPARNRAKAREHVGGAETFDVVGGQLFALLLAEGLRETDTVLDIGCGNLRVGRLLIAYLLEKRYHGIDPEEWVVKMGVEHETGRGLIEHKEAWFAFAGDYDFGVFETEFDVAFAGSVLSHTFQDEAAALFRGVAEVLAPGGAFHATYIEEGSALAKSRPMPNGKDRNGWAAAGLVYTRDQIEDLAEVVGFDARFGPLVPMSVHPLEQQWVTFAPGEADRGDALAD